MGTLRNILRSIGFGLLIVSVPLVLFGQSGREYRRTAVHNGNQVRTVFGNWGVIGQPSTGGPRGSWQNDNNGYVGDVSPLVGAEVNLNGTVFHSVVTIPVERPTELQDEDPLTGKKWTFEPLAGYFNANQQKLAMSTDKNSWPSQWPDKLDDPIDPGWRGSWNGYFGKRVNADQESYFVMDDNNDERFYLATNNTFGVAFHPDSLRPSRKGLALDVRVRGMQWSQFLAKDNIFWLYEITNTGTTNYNKVVFGMLVGTYVGVTGTDDSPQEYDDDWSFYDVSTNITYTGDFDRNVSRNPLWKGPVGMVGYAFLESPGNPFDGIDNDGDSDSTGFGNGAPKFTQTSFDSTVILPGDQVVLIGDDFSRTLFTIPTTDSVVVTTRGLRLTIRPGTTKVAEGNVLRDVQQNEFINPNSYDGIDNDLDGIIDENYYLHYRQIKRTRTTPPVTLIDILRPVRYIDYRTGAGSAPTSMLDERRDDRIDNDGDWILEFDDVGRDGIPNTGDFGEGDNQPTSGYDALGFDTNLPGEPNIDKTDVDESDQIGLTSFYYFTPAGRIRLGDDESLWRNLAPGYFDVPTSIVNNRPERGEDGDFIYGSGYFPLLAGATERFSLALVYGGGKGGSFDDDLTDLLKNKKTVQQIYNSNYQFPQPPDKPTLVAVPGDKSVTLYWDRKSEESLDPVLKVRDFEGYKIYRSTDPDFSDIFTITDATGSPQAYRPLAQFDVRNGIKGYFRANPELFQSASGFSFYLGDDSGILHSYVDREVENGRRYFYALVGYDRGDESVGIFPAENSKFVTILPTGEIITDQNVALVTPNARTAGYVKPDDGVLLDHVTRYGTGDMYYHVLDDAEITGHRYRVEFLDTQVDGIDNNDNGLLDAADSTEWNRLASFYSVRDRELITEQFISEDTALVQLARQHLIGSTVIVRNAGGAVVQPASYDLDTARGEIRGTSAGSLPSGVYSIAYEYYPVYQSPFIRGTPFEMESADADIFDGLELTFNNVWYVDLSDSASGWVGKNAYVYNFVPLNVDLGGQPYLGYARPADYEMRFASTVVDTSTEDPDLYPFTTPARFRIYNATDSVYIKFIFVDNDFNGLLSPIDEIVFLEENPRGELTYTWDLFFINKPGDPVDTVYNLTDGDGLVLKTTKSFRQGDRLEFTSVRPSVDHALANSELDRVRVVPNPYVTASPHEPPLPPGITSGRGERKIDFVHVPANSKIDIFTARGEHVVTLYHDGNIQDGTVSWNVKSKENLEIAFGVYYYVLESAAGKKTGKIAIIK